MTPKALTNDRDGHLNKWYGVLAALWFSFSPYEASAVERFLGTLPAAETYAATVSRRQSTSQDTQQDPHAMLLDESEDMFSHDAWVGMKRFASRVSCI